LKKLIHLIGSRTLDLPACSIALTTSAPYMHMFIVPENSAYVQLRDIGVLILRARSVCLSRVLQPAESVQQTHSCRPVTPSLSGLWIQAQHSEQVTAVPYADTGTAQGSEVTTHFCPSLGHVVWLSKLTFQPLLLARLRLGQGTTD
jgi:hypothetical protein